MKWPGFISGNEKKVYEILCMGIAGSLIFWPLASSLFSVLLFLWWLLITRPKIPANQRNGYLVLLFASLYLLVIVGSFYSSDMDQAFFKLQQKSALLIFPVVFGYSRVLDVVSFRKISKAFYIFTFLGCFVCLLNGLFFYFKNGSAIKLHGYEMVILKDLSPFVLAMFCLLSLLFLAHRFYQKEYRGTGDRTLTIFLILFFSFFLLLLGNRNVLISWILVVGYYIMKMVKNWWWRLAILFFMITSLLSAVVFNPSLNRQWHDMMDASETNVIPLDEDKSLGRSWGGKAIRLAIWKCSADIIKENWLTGVGTGDAQQALQDSYENRKFYFASRYNTYNAHNQYIQDTITYGIAGFLLLVACFIVPLVLNAKYNSPTYSLFLLCFLFICLTESVFELSKGIILYSFFNSIFAFTEGKTAHYERPG